MSRVASGTEPWGAALNADLNGIEAKADTALADLSTRLSAAELAETIRDTLGTALVGGSNVTVSVNDVANTITVSATPTPTDPEVVRDTIAAALVAGTNVTITANDAGDTITIAASGAGGSTDPEIVRDTMAAALTAGANVTITPNDAGDTITIAAASSTAFALSGVLDGDVQVGDVISGGIAFPVSTVVDKIMVNLDQEARGTNMIIQVIRRVRSTGTDSLLGTMTITHTTSRRASLTSLNTTFAADDRLILRVTQVGDTQAGAGLNFTILGIGSSLPSVLSSPAAVTGLSAVKATNDITVSWTAPASGVYLGVDIWRDGAFYSRILKGTTSFTDIGEADAPHDYEVRSWNLDAVSTSASASYTPAAAGIGNPIQVATGGLWGGLANTAFTMTLTASVDVGDYIIVEMGGSVPTGLAWSWVVTDNRGNTYTTLAHAYNNASSQQVAIAAARVTTQLQVGDTITCTNSAGNGTLRLLGVAHSVSGIVAQPASTGVDKTNAAVSSTSNVNLNTGATGTLAQANEIAIAAFVSMSANQPFTPAAGWSTMPSFATANGASDRTIMTQFRIVSVTTSLTGTGTLTTSGIHAGAIATFKGA